MIGVALDRGEWVLDVDDKPAGTFKKRLAWLLTEFPELRNAPQTQTPRPGRHFWLGHPIDVKLVNRTGVLGGGFDVRAFGSFVIVPPSVNAIGKQYALRDGPRELIDAPEALLAQLETRPIEFEVAQPRIAKQGRWSTRDGEAYAEAALIEEAERVAYAIRGSRNEVLNKAAFSLGTLVATGVIETEVVFNLLMSAARHCSLVADDGEQAAASTIESGLTAGMCHPRPAPTVGGHRHGQGF